VQDRSGAFFLGLLIVSFGLVGCAGLVAGNNGNPPMLAITNVVVGTTAASSCQVDWATNVPADSAVDYGTNTSYGSSTPVDSAMVTSHQIVLSGLTPGTVYYFQVRSTDSKSNNARSGGHSFKTPGGGPSITTQPASQTVTAGQTASFSVAATGTAALSYQWNKNGTALAAATSSTYTTPATTSSDNGAQFTVVVSNTAGSVTSNAATLTVNAAPVAPSITTQPASQTVTAGQTASFSVAASGTAPLSYQWRKNSVAISGATSSSYTTPATTSSDNGAQFTVVVSNTAGSVTSNAATLTVNVPQPPSVNITSPADGATVSGTITVAGTASDAIGLSSVQVQIDGGAFSPASGTTNWTFNLDTTSLSNAAHSVTARATNTSGLSASTAITVNVSNSGTIINVLNYGATGNGTNDDTAAIKNAIAALQPGDTLLFPCTANSTYLVTSQLTINISNVTVDGSSCAILHNTSSGAVMVIGGSGNGNPNYGPAVALSVTANELAASFTTASSLGVAAGDYLRLQQGGKDSSNGSTDTGCDPSGCRGEVLKVASVFGNTITVTTALHDTFNPSLNAATAQKILNPLTGIAVKSIAFDGSGSNIYGLEMAGVAESTVSGVTSRNVQGSALLNRGDFNVSWSNITVTGAGSAQCGSAVWFENQGNLSVNGMSISSENQGASGSGCLANGAFGFELIASANSTITNLTVDAAGAYGRPFKTTAARYNTFNSPAVKNGVQAYNGISLEYYSSHNAYNSCIVTNNGAVTGTGTGNAGIITFGNFNQYNTFTNCTVSGNGNVQFYISGFDALRLAQDSHNNVVGGSFTGSNGSEAVLLIEGDGTYIDGTTISGPGAQGIYLDTQASNACVNNNTFTLGSSLGTAISANGSGDLGLGNILNLLSSNLTLGTCSPPLP
jgi:Bacterial Ig domain/Purple acid Phosphatase, N-terminal domain/Immunoglobulin domain